MRALSAFAVLMLVSACQTAAPEGLLDADRAAIDELAASYQAAVRAGDLDAWVELWTTDAVYQIPEAPTLVGRDQIRADMELYPTPTEMNLTINESDGSGNWAWARGNWDFFAAATEDMAETKLTGSVLFVFEKQQDGTWLIDTECYNLDAPQEVVEEG